MLTVRTPSFARVLLKTPRSSSSLTAAQVSGAVQTPTNQGEPNADSKYAEVVDVFLTGQSIKHNILREDGFRNELEKALTSAFSIEPVARKFELPLNVGGFIKFLREITNERCVNMLSPTSDDFKSPWKGFVTAMAMESPDPHSIAKLDWTYGDILKLYKEKETWPAQFEAQLAEIKAEWTIDPDTFLSGSPMGVEDLVNWFFRNNLQKRLEAEKSKPGSALAALIPGNIPDFMEFFKTFPRLNAAKSSWTFKEVVALYNDRGAMRSATSPEHVEEDVSGALDDRALAKTTLAGSSAAGDATAASGAPSSAVETRANLSTASLKDRGPMSLEQRGSTASFARRLLGSSRSSKSASKAAEQGLSAPLLLLREGLFESDVAFGSDFLRDEQFQKELFKMLRTMTASGSFQVSKADIPDFKKFYGEVLSTTDLVNSDMPAEKDFEKPWRGIVKIMSTAIPSWVRAAQAELGLDLTEEAKQSWVVGNRGNV